MVVGDREAARDRQVSCPQTAAPPPWHDESVQARWLDVQSAMATLSPIERTAIVLVAIEGWSYDETAEALSTTSGALRAAVSRARAKLEVA